MLKWFMNWLKWKIAHAEMAELERWRIQWHEHRRWLAEFPDAACSLDHLKQEVTGLHYQTIHSLRDVMRERRSHAAAKEGAQG